MEQVHRPVGSATGGADSPVTARESLGDGITSMLVVAAWFGLASGVILVAILGFRLFVTGHMVKRSSEVIWMAPLSQLVVFLVLALALLPLALALGRRSTMFGVAIFSFLGAISLLLSFGQLARWSAVILALAVAVQAVRWYRVDPNRRHRQMARGAAVMAGLVALAGIGQRLWRVVGARVAISRLTAADSASPNVLLIILDTVRRDNLSLYGYARPTTPALNAWAAEGVVFERAFATAPWTLPSHGSLFSGEYPWRLSGDWLIPMRFERPPLAEVFKGQGYRTAGFVSNLTYTTRETGLSRGFIEYEDFPTSIEQFFRHNPLIQISLVFGVLESRSLSQIRSVVRSFNLAVDDDIPVRDRQTAEVITDRFLRWHSGVGTGPFFAFLNYMDAHARADAPGDFRRLFPGKDRLNRYDAAIAYLDFEVDRLLRELQRRGVLDRTIVVISSDHGEHFGEHGLIDHGNSLYDPVLQIPLMIRYPGRVSAGVRVPAVVSLRDVPATVLDLASLPEAADFPGSSLASFFGGRDTGKPPSRVLSELSQAINQPASFRNSRTWLKSVLDERYHYIRNGLGEEELYDLAVDSQETTNLAGDGGHRPTVLAMHQLLDSLVSPGPQD